MWSKYQKIEPYIILLVCLSIIFFVLTKWVIAAVNERNKFAKCEQGKVCYDIEYAEKRCFREISNDKKFKTIEQCLND